MPLRVIARRVGVNVGIAKMNRDVISGDGDTVVVAGFAGGSDLDRLVFWRLDINGAASSSRKKEKKKDRCPRSHGAPRRYRRATVLQRRKAVPPPSMASARQAQSQPASLLVETTGQHDCARIDGWLRRPWQRSSFQRFCGCDELPKDGSAHAFAERDFW